MSFFAGVFIGHRSVVELRNRRKKIDVLFERKKGVGRIINKKLNVW